MPDDLSIPAFLKREVPMSETSAEAKAKPAKAAKTTPAKAPVKPAEAVKAPAKAAATPEADDYGYRANSIKSKAAALYAAKSGATLDEVKAALGSVQLNLLKELEGKGFKVKRTKEAGTGKRQVTRYHLTK